LLRAGSSHIRVLVVDDSALVRQRVRRHLETDPELHVVDTAHDGLDALVKVERLQPDVVTMDVEMPTMDGLSALRLLMARFPRPVVMLSSATDHGTQATVQALALGAVDYIAKPEATDPDVSSFASTLITTVKRASQARVRRTARVAPTETTFPTSSLRHTPEGGPERLLVIGASTGGPRALAELLGALPGDLDCTVIVVQHLPEGFTRSLAERLDQVGALTVREAIDGEDLQTGVVLVAPGGRHLTLVRDRVALDARPRRHGVRPSIDTTLESAAATFGPSALAVVLTGMGQDGSEGTGAIKAAGGRVLVEAEESCVVFGMPHAVIKAGFADDVLPLAAIPAAVARAIAAMPARSR
jgi:two-component system chemotaxis response regulator CheB